MAEHNDSLCTRHEICVFSECHWYVNYLEEKVRVKRRYRVELKRFLYEKKLIKSVHSTNKQNFISWRLTIINAHQRKVYKFTYIDAVFGVEHVAGIPFRDKPDLKYETAASSMITKNPHVLFFFLTMHKKSLTARLLHFCTIDGFSSPPLPSLSLLFIQLHYFSYCHCRRKEYPFSYDN